MPSMNFYHAKIRAEVNSLGGLWTCDLIVVETPGYKPPSETVLSFAFRTEAEAHAMADRINGQPHVQAHETEAA